MWLQMNDARKKVPMIGLELSLGSDAAHRIELLQTLKDLSENERKEIASSECRVFEDLAHPNRFFWLQWWRSEQHLEDHLRSSPFRTLLASIKILGTLESARIVELQDSTSVVSAFLGGSGESKEFSPTKVT